MQKTFFELIRRENANGVTVLLSSHILSEVQKLCSRVAIIKEGRIVKLEDIGTLRDTAYKKVRIEFNQGFPPTWPGRLASALSTETIMRSVSYSPGTSTP